MKRISSLPLIAIVSLGVAACGGPETEAESDVELAGERAEAELEQGANEIERETDQALTEMERAGNEAEAEMESMTPAGMGDSMVTVTVSGVQPDGGTVYVGLQDTTDFATLEVEQGGTAEPTGETVEVMIDGVANGRYAVVAFQDTDGDGTTNLGATGPAEPWGISGYEGGSSPNPMNAMMDVQGDTSAEVELQGGA